MKIKDMTLIAVMAALICIAGPMTVAVGPVPLSLATFAVILAGAVLGTKRGTAAVGLYLLIGIIGVPVFSGFSGGFQKLAGVTGGYLIGENRPEMDPARDDGPWYGGIVYRRHGLVHDPDREQPGRGAGPVRAAVPARRRGEDFRRGDPFTDGEKGNAQCIMHNV